MSFLSSYPHVSHYTGGGGGSPLGIHSSVPVSLIPGMVVSVYTVGHSPSAYGLWGGSWLRHVLRRYLLNVYSNERIQEDPRTSRKVFREMQSRAAEIRFLLQLTDEERAFQTPPITAAGV